MDSRVLLVGYYDQIGGEPLPPVGTFVTYSYQPKIDLFGAPSKIVTKGVISAIYPSYFVIDNGLYKQCFNKVDIATGYLVRVA